MPNKKDKDPTEETAEVVEETTVEEAVEEEAVEEEVVDEAETEERPAESTPMGVLSVDPNPIPLGTNRLIVHGKGFAPDSRVYVAFTGEPAQPVETVANGSFQWQRDGKWREPGAMSAVEAYDNEGRLLASETVTVLSQ